MGTKKNAQTHPLRRAKGLCRMRFSLDTFQAGHVARASVEAAWTNWPIPVVPTYLNHVTAANRKPLRIDPLVHGGLRSATTQRADLMQ